MVVALTCLGGPLKEQLKRFAFISSENNPRGRQLLKASELAVAT